MYSYIWIEGEKNLDEFCMKRFGEEPHFLENYGHVSGNGVSARVQKIYKEDSGGNYHQMFFLWMEYEGGRYCQPEIDKIRRWPYEKIRTDRTAILRKRG